MTGLLAGLLIANALFNLIAWPRFFRRVADDPRARDTTGRRTRFFTVHAVLIGIAIGLALASAAAAAVALLLPG